jgi:hypothetical protein
MLAAGNFNEASKVVLRHLIFSPCAGDLVINLLDGLRVNTKDTELDVSFMRRITDLTELLLAGLDNLAKVSSGCPNCVPCNTYMVIRACSMARLTPRCRTKSPPCVAFAGILWIGMRLMFTFFPRTCAGCDRRGQNGLWS